MDNKNYFFLNGEKYLIESELNLIELMNYLNYDKTILVVEYNNLICERNEWNNVVLKNQDKIEIVTIVGGG